MPGTFQRHCSQSCMYSDETTWRPQWKIQCTAVPLETSGKAISKTLNFKLFLGTSALKNLCIWCEFQSRVLFIISVVLRNFLKVLYQERSLTFKTSCIIITVPVHLWLRILITKLIISSPFIRVRQYCKCIADCCKEEQNIKFYE